MKKTKFSLASLCMSGLLLCTAMGLSSCSEEEIKKLTEQANNTPAPGPNTDSSIPLPDWTDASGILVTTKAKTVTSGVSIDIGLATAVFYANVGDSTFTDAGAVNVEATALTKQSNNAYVFTPSQTNAQGITFSSPISWDIAGSGSVTAFTHDLTGAYPNADSVTSSLSFDNNNPYTLTVGNVSGADSVLFMIAGSSGTPLIKYLAGNATSCTFSATEMATIPAGTGIVQAVPMRITDNTISGKKYYYIRQTSVSKTVTVAD